MARSPFEAAAVTASVDYTAIRMLVERYADAINRRDVEALAETWAPDGVWEIGGVRYEGRDAIITRWQPLMSSIVWVVQTINNGTVDADGDDATCRWYHTDFVCQGDGTRRMSVGLYYDTCTRREGRWVFTSRRYVRLGNILLNDADLQMFSPTGEEVQ
jgi:uncharacterized protein (TIGR02246 family)